MAQYKITFKVLYHRYAISSLYQKQRVNDKHATKRKCVDLYSPLFTNMVDIRHRHFKCSPTYAKRSFIAQQAVRVATHYAPAPASRTIISCKYVTVKDYNLPLNSLKHKQQQHEKISNVLFYQVCADTVKAKQSTAEYGRWLCLFCPSNKLTFDFLILKVVSQSHVTWAIPLCQFQSFQAFLFSTQARCTRQTDRRQTASSLNAPAYQGRGIINAIIEKLGILAFGEVIIELVRRKCIPVLLYVGRGR